MDIIDIVLLTLVIFWILKLTSKTRAMQVLKGLGLILVAAWVTDFLGLVGIRWLLNYVLSIGAILVVLLFQPELRRALAQLGRGRHTHSSHTLGIVENLLKAILRMSKERTGALIVFERKTGLKEVLESGTRIGADITSELIESVFITGSPLHDGAMIIREGIIEAAGCFLPLSDNKEIGQELGTRHRAALGVSEVSDSITIVVSEETGVISQALDGKLIRYLDSNALKKMLEELYMVNQQKKSRKPKQNHKERDTK